MFIHKIIRWQKNLRPWQQRLLFIGLLITIYMAAQFYQQRNLVSGAAPVIQAMTLQREAIDQTLWQKQPVLINFWATWCPVCKLEQDMINALAKDYRVITVAMNSGGEDAIEAYLTENKLEFPVIVDAEGQLARRFGVRGVPTGFVIDTAGQIRFKEVGLTSSWGWRVRLWLATVL